MANALSAISQVLRGGGMLPAKKTTATKVVKTKKKTTEARRVRTREHAGTRILREYGINAAGSWEEHCQLIRNAALISPQFGADGNGGCNYGITLVASFPAKSAVIIGNYDTGELWAATYMIDANNSVTFPIVKRAKQTFALAEAMKEARAAARAARSTRVGESGLSLAPPKKKVAESFRMLARLREVKVSDAGAITAECVMLEEGPGNPVDGHYYPGELIDRIAENGVFEGVQSYADHQDDVEERARGGVRSIKDLIGWWSDVHVEEAGGKKLLVGTFNIETGNEFAQNKMLEAKRFNERYKNDPSKQYVGFSIIGSGSSERQEIDGKQYNVVLDITEAGSTDMVARAGAGGRMLTLGR